MLATCSAGQRAPGCPGRKNDGASLLVQITAPHFCAGLVLDDDVVTTAAPIIHYMAEQRWTRDRVRAYCRSKGWSVSVVSST